MFTVEHSKEDILRLPRRGEFDWANFGDGNQYGYWFGSKSAVGSAVDSAVGSAVNPVNVSMFLTQICLLLIMTADVKYWVIRIC